MCKGGCVDAVTVLTNLGSWELVRAKTLGGDPRAPKGLLGWSLHNGLPSAIVC